MHPYTPELREHRLLRFAGPNTNANSEALDAFEKDLPEAQETRMAEHLEEKLTEGQKKALAALDSGNLSSWQWFTTLKDRTEARWGNAVTAQAKERLQQTNDRLAKSHNSALQKLSARVSRSFRSASLLTYEQGVLEDSIAGLRERREFLLQASQQYREAAEALGLNVETGTVDPPEVKSIDEQIAKLETMIETNAERVESGPEQEALERVKQADEYLRKFLMEADPHRCVGNINNWIIEAASGDPSNLKRAIKAIKFDDDTRRGILFFKNGRDSEQRQVLLSLVDEITGGGKQWIGRGRTATNLRRQAAASYYTQQTVGKAEEVLSEKITERVQALKDLPVGTNIVIGDVSFGITKHQVNTGKGKGKKKGPNCVFLLSRRGNERAVINLDDATATLRLAGSPPADKHYSLLIPAKSATRRAGARGGPDPSRVEFAVSELAA